MKLYECPLRAELLKGRSVVMTGVVTDVVLQIETQPAIERFVVTIVAVVGGVGYVTAFAYH